MEVSRVFSVMSLGVPEKCLLLIKISFFFFLFSEQPSLQKLVFNLILIGSCLFFLKLQTSNTFFI